LANEPLLSISEASQLLGVSEGALRQWTDEGKIRAFITPGGHRRYSRVELKKFMDCDPKIFSMKDLVVELEETARMHREIAQASLKKMAWYDRLDEMTAEHLADLGRQMLNLIIRFITEPSQREKTVKLIRDAGHDHGETLAKLGLPLSDSVEAFLMHRDPIMHAATNLIKKREAVTGRIVEAAPMAAHIMDEALIALVNAHQRFRKGIKIDVTGGTPK
jgi:excisionase family DNA binding protein